ALTLGQLYVVGFLTGTLSVLFYVAYSTLFVTLVPRERYVEANSLLHGSRALSFVAGPSIGGVLVQVLSAPAAIVADALSSVVTGRIGRRLGIGPAFVLGCVLFPVPLVLVPLAGGPRWVVLGCLFLAEFFSGFGVMILDIAGGSLKAALVPDRLRARVSGAY